MAESAVCIYCESSDTIRVVPDRLRSSPWECSNCGGIFGTAETDWGLLRQHGRPPRPFVDVPQGVSSSDERCSRCGNLIDEEETNRILTNKGPVCGNCLTLEELREI